MRNIFLLSKDACGKFNLPVYGNKIHHTPNIDVLAESGTVFHRHYTAAPSTAMSFTSILTGQYPYKLPRKLYEKIDDIDYHDCFMDRLHSEGYECHTIIPAGWETWCKDYVGYFGEQTKMHFIQNDQSVGAFFNRDYKLTRDFNKIEETYQLITDTIDSIFENQSKPIMTWMHLPHVIKGYEGYGSDIEFLDRIVGYLIRKLGTDAIYLTTDHGHMNYTKNKVGYGFDVYENAICIPLITPKIAGMDKVDFPTSNIDLADIILNGQIIQREFIISDSAYYAQPKRKVAIIKNNYKYIFNKRDKTEELYDLDLDPQEESNLIQEKKFDVDRNQSVWISDYYYYPYWEQSKQALNQLRECFKTFYKEEDTITKYKYRTREYLSKHIMPLYMKVKNRHSAQ